MAIKLVIAGAGGLGREIALYATALGWEVVGFIDDTKTQDDKLLQPILGGLSNHQPRQDCQYLVAIGDSAARAKIAAQLANKGAHFATLLHPLSVVAPSAEIAAGSMIAPFSCIGPNSQIGAHSLVNCHSCIGHDVHLADYVTVALNASVCGYSILREGAFVASNCVITPHAEIGAYAKIAAGSVVYGNIADKAEALGNPARTRT